MLNQVEKDRVVATISFEKEVFDALMTMVQNREGYRSIHDVVNRYLRKALGVSKGVEL